MTHKGNCLNCNSATSEIENSKNRQSKNADSELITSAFDSALQKNKIGIELPDESFCHSCRQTLLLYCHSRKQFLKLTKSNSKISDILAVESYNLTTQSSKLQESSEENQKITSDLNEDTILPDKEGEPEIILSDHQGVVDVVEYKELFAKLTLKKLSNSLTQSILSNISGIDFHKCETCSRTFTDAQQLENHNNIAHSLNKSLSCNFCTKRFSMVWFLKNHLKASHSGIEIVHICQICRNEFYSKMDLENHLLKSHDIRKYPFKCKNCEASFKVITELRNHLVKTHKGTKQANAAENNIQAAAEKKLEINKCLFCEKVFENPSTLRKHINSKHVDELKNCEICHRQFKCYNELVRHRRSHKECRVCKKKFVEYQKMKLHYDTVHVIRDNLPYVCEMCGQKYSHLNSLKMHYIWHVDISGPNHYCNICNKMFKLKGHLNQHMKQRHSENYKKHKCPFCNRAFMVKGNLNSHITVKHSPKLKYPCKICGKKFLNSKGASTHSRIHTLETKYSSDKKNMKSVTLKNEKLEVMSCYSSETYLFTCPFCGKSTDAQTHFYRHLRTIHDIKGYADPAVQTSIVPCPICAKEFPRRDSVNKHIRKFHKLSSTCFKI